MRALGAGSGDVRVQTFGCWESAQDLPAGAEFQLASSGGSEARLPRVPR